MPDGPRYDDDFYAWTQYQAEVLRDMPAPDNRFDREHVAEEIEDLGNSQRAAVRSQIRRILVHLLKLAFSPANDPRFDWMGSIVDGRAELDDKLSPTLKCDIEENLPRLYARARKQAVVEFQRYGEYQAVASIPTECPYTLDQILADDWYPEPPANRHRRGEPLMPDGPRYDDDFYAWTQYQAEVLRDMPAPDNRFDREHVAEEIEDLGKSERNAMRSEVRRILEHFLKLAHSPAAEPRAAWKASIANARAELDDRLTATLRRDIEAELPRLYARAKDVAEVSLDQFGEADAATRFPSQCPYSLDEIMKIGWYPEPPATNLDEANR